MQKFSFGSVVIIFSLIVSAVSTFLFFYFIKEATSAQLLTFFIVSFVLPAFFSRIFFKTWFSHIISLAGKKINENRKQKSDALSNRIPLHQLLDHEVTEWINERKNEIEQLKKLENYRKEFLGNVSHELKTPIFNIQGYILTLLDGGLEDKTINRDYLQRAERSIDRMISIIDDLEAISHLETGELQLEIERFELISLIKDVFDAQEMKADSRKIKLTLNDSLTVAFVMADKFRVRQVLTNLVVNSVKYGKDGGETKIEVKEQNDQIVVEVSDNGIGIGAEHLPRLFERFYRVDKSRSRDQGGTGLGLAIVKHIIEAHGQTIKVSSIPGAGTTFTFTLNKW